MALRFRLRGLAETFIDSIICPCCRQAGSDEDSFSTELTKVTLEGIIVIVQCRTCLEIFVPESQRMGIINPLELRSAVKKDSLDTGEALLPNLGSVRISAERLNAMRKGDVH